MEEVDFNYQDEELDEIEYFEIVSYNEIIKLNPTFVAFSNDEIYNHLLGFFQSTIKAESFLKLFNEIIDRQKNPTKTNNFIIVADAKRGNFTEVYDNDEEEQEAIKEGFRIGDFVAKIKSSNKEQVQLAFKNKNKLWFPLDYDNESNRMKFNAKNTTIVDLIDNDKYIIFKDDERDIPIMGVYFYEPVVQDNNNLNEKICSHLIEQRQKDEIHNAEDHKDFNDLINSYKIKLPLNKIDEDDYNYLSLNNLLKKFNYDLDYIDAKDFEIISNYLKDLNKKEKKVDVKYSAALKNRKIHLDNNRFVFYTVLKKAFGLVDITLMSAKKLQSELELIKSQKVFIDPLPLHKDLASLITNINNDNYNDIIKNLRDIRKNVSIDNCSTALESYLKVDMDLVKKHFEKIENKFNLLMGVYKDLYEISFSFEKEIKEFKLGNDIKNYEGVPVNIDVITESNIEEVEDLIEEKDQEEQTEELNKFYNNYYFNLEKGFAQSLKKVLPFVMKVQELCRLPINLTVITNHLFNLHRGIPEKYTIIREKYKDKYDEAHCKEQALKTEEYVLKNDGEDKLLKDANKEYLQIITNMIYDVLCKWSIELQREILDETLLYAKDIYYIPCYELWNEYGAPYNMETKDGVLYYLICIFEDVYKEMFYYHSLEKGFKANIITRLTENYANELKQFQKDEVKKKKENKGLEAQKRLAKFLQDKNYTDDKFFEAFIQSLIYMPSVKFEKIHKYLLGCCLEQIDSDFTADKFFKTNRKDLEKAKSKFSGDRVLNKKRYLRFYLSKTKVNEKQEKFQGIKYESLKYPIYEKSLESWFKTLNDTTILSKSNIDDIRIRLVATYQTHLNDYLPLFDKNKIKLFKTYKFSNYRQLLITVSTTLFSHLKEKAMTIIYKINNTIEILDKLNSIINDDNETDIHQIMTIIIIRGMCLPCFPDIKKISNLYSYLSLDIEKDVYNKIFADIKTRVFKIMEENKMPTLKEQIDYINKMREENKDKILANLNKKTREEKDILKELKKIGLEEIMDDEVILDVNKPKNDDDMDIEGEGEFSLEIEDDEADNYEKDDFGFIYAD
jgi:hypothetical protein